MRGLNFNTKYILALMIFLAACKGKDGLNALVNTVNESPGQNCKSGGVRIESGQDANANDVLDANEVKSTYFMCNDSKEYIALLSQAGTSAPTANTLLNTLNVTITWTREAAGKYIGTLDKAIDVNKTTILTNVPIGNGHTGVTSQITSDTKIRLEFEWGINVFNDNWSNVTFVLRQY